MKITLNKIILLSAGALLASSITEMINQQTSINSCYDKVKVLSEDYIPKNPNESLYQTIMTQHKHCERLTKNAKLAVVIRPAPYALPTK